MLGPSACNVPFIQTLASVKFSNVSVSVTENALPQRQKMFIEDVDVLWTLAVCMINGLAVKRLRNFEKTIQALDDALSLHFVWGTAFWPPAFWRLSKLKMSRLITKPAKWHVRPAKTQISLGIRPVWSEASAQSDQRHPPRLIRVFAVRMKKAWVLSYPLSAQRRLLSDFTDVHDDLSGLGAHVILMVLSRCGSNND